MSSRPEKNLRGIRSGPSSLTSQSGCVDTDVLVAESKPTGGNDQQRVFLLAPAALEDEGDAPGASPLSPQHLLPQLQTFALLFFRLPSCFMCCFHLPVWEIYAALFLLVSVAGRAVLAGGGWVGLLSVLIRLLFPVTVGSGVRVGSNGDKHPTAPYISARLSCCRLARWLTLVRSRANQMQICRI